MDQKLSIGGMFAERFRIIRLLGKGAMGQVYLAEHGVMRRMVAIKVLHQAAQQSAKTLGRFRREARAACRIEHPHVALIYDFGHDEHQTPYLVMEFVEGPSLAEVLNGVGPLPLSRAVNIMVQIAGGLAAAHRCRVIHRDLKPANVMLTTIDGLPDWVKLMDFGLAKILDPDETTGLSVTGHVMGTPQYMSPEQVTGQQVDHRSDIYNLGILGFELLVGGRPFGGKLQEVLKAHVYSTPPAPSDASGRKDIPPALDRLILNCLEKEPSNRPAQAEKVQQALHSL